MKLLDKSKLKKQKIKKKPISKPKKEKVLLVAQEFKFARLLSGNEKKTRDRVLKAFKKWLSNCFEKKYEFKEDDFIRVWKGLFYAVWMSDKPLVQEDMCESIAATLDLFPADQIEYAIMMIKAGFKVLATEWYGIDQHRMDKFLMLVRRYLRGSFRCLQRCDWKLKSCQMFANMLCSSDGILALKTPLYARNAASLMLHITDCYLEEISKVSKGEIPDESLVALLYPFSVQVCGGDGTLAFACKKVFTELIQQSDLGLEYDIATSAWQKLGCPAGGPEALERVSDDDDDDDVDDANDEQADESMENGEQLNGPEPLDPRAGRVDVTLQPLPVPAALLAEQLRQLMAAATSKAYRRANVCVQRFEELSRNQYPLRVPAADAAGLEPRPQRAESRRAATRLHALEKQLVAQSDELALRGLSRKHRKRLLAKARSGVNIADELYSETTPADSTNGGWHVETTENKTKESDSNKENKVIEQKKNRKRKLQDKTSEEHNKKPKTDKINKSRPLETKEKKKIDDKKITNANDESIQNIKMKNVKKDSKTNKIVSNMKSNKVSNSDKGKDNKLSNGSGEVKDSKKKPTTQDKILNIKTTQKANDVTVNKTIVKKQEDLAKGVTKNTKPHVLVNKVKNYQKQVNSNKKKDGSPKKKANMESPKKVKFVLKNNSMQETVDYYKSVRQSPNIPFDSSKKPTKTNLKPSTPSPINPFFKKKLKLKKF